MRKAMRIDRVRFFFFFINFHKVVVMLICTTVDIHTPRHHLLFILYTVSLALWKGVLLQTGRPGFESRFGFGSFSRSSLISDFKLGIPVANLPDAWRYGVSAGTG